MRSLTAVALAFAAAVAACSGAPPSDGSPDFEIDDTAKRPASPGDGSGSSGADPTATPAKSSSSSSSGAPAPTTTPTPAPTSGSSSGGAPAPAPTTVSLTIDGVAVTVTGTDVWAGVSAPGMYDVFLKVSGPGIAVGSDFVISATSSVSGCDNTANYITYRPQGDTQYMPKSAEEPTCGLTIETLPAAVNDRFKGTFKATLYGINTTTPKSHKIDLTFDVLRTK
jgi:hypothetical protein